MASAINVVTVKQGKLRGKTEYTEKGFKFHSFLGIPYAKPPLGNLRFKNPEPADKWQGILEATQDGTNCYSHDALLQEYRGSEDCLFINVFTPELPATTNKQRAVMVWIHGGGFLFGSNERKQYGPEYLIDKDIVLVSINYRLGVLGFLCLEDKELGMYGNVGMHDQVLALKWVQDNIAEFGGDPNNVTIFGESAGGASVHLHMLSRLSTGLFHKAIMQSGTSICPWAYGQPNGLILSNLLGYSTNNEDEALQILQNTTVKKLVEAQNKLPDNIFPGVWRYFAPVVEPPHNGPIFLHEKPENILKSGNFNKVPVLMGYNSEEGLFMKMIQKQHKLDILPIDFECFVSHNYALPKGSLKSKEIAKRIKAFYYGSNEPNQSNINKFYKILSHSSFARCIQMTIEETLKNSNENLYFYILSLQCELNRFAKLAKIEDAGVGHAEDLFYIFHHSTMSPKLTPGEIEDIAIQRMTKWWSNFAKYGNPNGIQKDNLLQPDWPHADLKSMQCLDINVDCTVCNYPEEKYMKFWKSIEEFALNK